MRHMCDPYGKTHFGAYPVAKKGVARAQMRFRPQHKSTSDPILAPKNSQFGAIFIEFGDTKKCYTF